MKPKTFWISLVLAKVAIIAFLLWFTSDRGPVIITPDLTTAGAPAPAITASAPLPGPDGSDLPSHPEGVSDERGEEEYWDEKIDETILDFADHDDTVRQRLFAIAADTKVPANSRIRALEHGLNLLGDEHYSEALAFLLGEQATAEMREAVFFDLQGRGDQLKLSACVEIIKRPNHPFSTQAGELLQFFTGADLGLDGQAWTQAVERYLNNAVARADES